MICNALDTHLPPARNTAGCVGQCHGMAFMQFVAVKGIIAQNSRRDYVENRNRLLRSLTL